MDKIQSFNEKLKREIDFLNQEIEKNEKIFLINSLINKGSKLNKIYLVQAIMNQALQYGNYRRALKYYLIANFLVKNIEKSKNKLLRNFTLDLIK